MQFAVGYSEHPESDIAGANAIKRALNNAGRDKMCDIVLLFATARHNFQHLRSGVTSVVGENTPIVGGAAIGAITNDRFGYAGEQVGLAAVWLDDIGFQMFSKTGIIGNEYGVGQSIGKSMLEANLDPETPSILLYDAIDRSRGDDARLNLATPLLQGIERSLGFLPKHLVGAGLQGDYQNSASLQFAGRKLADQYAMMLTFSKKLRIDSVIMHGCHPHGDYYTVTKADGQTILEIDGRPALSYIHSKLKPSLPVEDFPFFMIFGINRDPDGPFNELNYANRLCLAIDPEREGITMFESDMIEGTRFQIMYRSLDLKYIPPKINSLFDGLNGRKPVFAFYINCAGRAARYGGEVEDSEIVMSAVNDRVPLLGIYSGVEIAPMMGRPRTLDWTGVFCLFSVEE